MKDFPCCGHGHFFILDEINRFRDLVPSDLSPAMVNKFLLGGSLSLVEGHNGLYSFSPLFMGDSNDGNIFYGRMGSKKILNL